MGRSQLGVHSQDQGEANLIHARKMESVYPHSLGATDYSKGRPPLAGMLNALGKVLGLVLARGASHTDIHMHPCDLTMVALPRCMPAHFHFQLWKVALHFLAA